MRDIQLQNALIDFVGAGGICGSAQNLVGRDEARPVGYAGVGKL
jgi:hypothetical protein